MCKGYLGKVKNEVVQVPRPSDHCSTTRGVVPGNLPGAAAPEPVESSIRCQP